MPTIREPSIRVIGGKVTIRGIVFGHDEHEDGDLFETPPIVVLNTAEMTASLKSGASYKLEGELK
jgi:hypothetical protein